MAGCHPVAIAQVVKHWWLKSEAPGSIPGGYHSSLKIFPSFFRSVHIRYGFTLTVNNRKPYTVHVDCIIHRNVLWSAKAGGWPSHVQSPCPMQVCSHCTSPPPPPSTLLTGRPSKGLSFQKLRWVNDLNTASHSVRHAAAAFIYIHSNGQHNCGYDTFKIHSCHRD